MITLKTEELKAVCTKIRDAVDSNGASDITETLEIVVKSGVLYLQVTNREYFVKVKLATNNSEDFHATIKAETFLKLVPVMTTELITLDTKDKSLIIKGNGEYPLPMIYDGENVVTLPEIGIANVTNMFDIDGAILNSIYKSNTRQLSNVKNVASPLQSLYYVDKDGAITFTTGACVNGFELEQDVKLLLNAKLVKLFKLFKNEKVSFSIGQDAVTEGLTQTKVRFITSEIELTAILPSNDEDISKYPAQAIRTRATKDYDYSITLNRLELLQAINRLVIFSERSTAFNRNYGRFEFLEDRVIIKDVNRYCSEEIFYTNSTTISDKYETTIDFVDLKNILEISQQDLISFKFGDKTAFVCSIDNISNVIPEIDV